jgi:hypothetical protein
MLCLLMSSRHTIEDIVKFPVCSEQPIEFSDNVLCRDGADGLFINSKGVICVIDSMTLTS